MSTVNTDAREAAEHDSLSVLDSAAYSIPKVNLLPPEIGERRRLRKLQAGLATFVIAVGGVVGLLYVQAGSGKAAAQSDLQSAQATQTTLQAQSARLSYVADSKAKIDAAKASLKAAMGSEVLWSKTLEELQRRLPDGVRYTNVAVVGVGPLAAGNGKSATSRSTASPGGPAALPANAIATITLQGKANTMDDVAAELDQLALVTGFTNVYLTSATRPAASAGDRTVTFTATANITNVVLSHRYDNITGAGQ